MESSAMSTIRQRPPRPTRRVTISSTACRQEFTKSLSPHLRRPRCRPAWLGRRLATRMGRSRTTKPLRLSYWHRAMFMSTPTLATSLAKAAALATRSGSMRMVTRLRISTNPASPESPWPCAIIWAIRLPPRSLMPMVNISSQACLKVLTRLSWTIPTICLACCN